MKETLRQHIERMRADLVIRLDHLNNSVKEYKEADDFENAMKCDIKISQLKVVFDRIVEALEYS